MEVVRPAGTVMEWFALLRDHVFDLQGRQASLEIWYSGPKGNMAAPTGVGGGKPIRWWTELFTGPPPTDAFLCRICGRWPRSRHDLNHTAANDIALLRENIRMQIQTARCRGQSVNLGSHGSQEGSMCFRHLKVSILRDVMKSCPTRRFRVTARVVR